MTTDNAEIRSDDEKVAAIGGCIAKFSETGVVQELDRPLLWSVFKLHGAIEVLPSDNDRAMRSLARYSNKGKHQGMQAVWGDRRKDFRTWTEQWADEYEQRTGDKLPRVVFEDEDTGERRPSRTEGMRQLLGELTGYAASCLDFGVVKNRLEARYYNFHRSKVERHEILVPGYNNDESFAPASFPPEFPKAAWEKIKGWRE